MRRNELAGTFERLSMARVSMRSFLIFAFAALLSVLATAAPAVAQGHGGQRVDIDVAGMKPGDFMWFDDPALMPASYSAAGPISIVISIPAQRAFVYRDGVLIAVSTVSTGSPGRDTPTGEYTILQKQVFHRSNLYSNAPMPFMQRLTWDGIALHSGHLPGYPASHGCIRLPNAFARQLYQLTDVGGEVSVIDEEVADPQFNVWTAPQIAADPANLGGEKYNIVTVGSLGPPPALVPAKGNDTHFTSWVTGPAAEVVQPIPAGTH